ncbi:ribosomal protein S18-alanine N-acetyltransferase [Corynebacterium sp. ES2794-CONJ1]|uniref:ribosomal protein S18-alanine N-acetyltransferase n=1 Tax=Corynebacterium sp. ES2794-CONJ1 TaxID=2980553 RepID=UPI0021DA7F59|nr:ribosomal protein S18-alanine N-acetyltransferase [Corynebacterium sp. ES2794-CONJ1]MCU9518869.1 ribosomal protein S18-alanine N-acetyltransferase [Corynebacterium sp. ES2794-CONJ1]
MQLREVYSGDIDRLVELERELFPTDSPWTEADFRAELAQEFTSYLAVVDPQRPEKLLGYVGLAFLGTPGAYEAEIRTIGVDPHFQRRGAAKLLMENVVYLAETLNAPIFLEVRCDNIPAISLYEGFGFVKIGVRKNYYQPSGADAFTMVREKKKDEQS